ncbi:MAG: rbn [Rhodospirillales bacterium]|nr:rbn [Rhodospirillales bacterium]
MQHSETSDRRRQALGAAIAMGVTLAGVALRRDDERALPPRTHGRHANWPSEIPARGWWDILKRVWIRVGEDNLSMMASSVAFYSLLSLFPGLTALISLYALVADPTQVQSFLTSMQGILPDEALKLIASQTEELLSAGTGKLGLGLAISLLFALWSANYATTMLITALNGVFEEKEKRSYLSVMATSLAMTTALVLFGIVSLLLVAILPAVIDILPLPETWRQIIGLVRWPLLAVLVAFALAAIYRYGPSRAHARWRWVSWGAVLATVLWIVVSYGFSLYVALFSTYDKTYGSLGAVVVLMMWLYLTSYVVLLGAEFDAEMEHQTGRDSTTGAPRPLGRRGARKADTVAAPD